MAEERYRPPKAALELPLESLSFRSFVASVALGALVAWAVRVSFTIAGEILRGKLELGDTPHQQIGSLVVLIGLIGGMVGSGVGALVAVRFRPGRWRLRALCVPVAVNALQALPSLSFDGWDALVLGLGVLGGLSGGKIAQRRAR